MSKSKKMSEFDEAMLWQAKRLVLLHALLERAAEYLCAAEPVHGEYCQCCGKQGDREFHKPSCFYLKVRKALKLVTR